jgi:peptidoglycan/xylan/chitin deacetylase (PgdA/CDA1 family)
VSLVGKRELLALALSLPLVGSSLRRLFGASCLVGLTYHRIGEVDDLDSGIVSTSLAELEWQARWLRDHVRVLDGTEVLAYLRGALTLRAPAVCVTFDDGYADNLAAGRLLERLGVPAIFFVTSGFVGTQNIAEWDRIAFAVKRTKRPELEVAAVAGQGPWRVAIAEREQTVSRVKRIYREIPTARQSEFVAAVEAAAGTSAESALGGRAPFMSWSDVQALHRLGHTIGAHSHSHPILSTLGADEQRRELAESKRLIEEQLGAPVATMAYPVGKPHTFTAETRRLARECGYEACFSFYGGCNRPGAIDAFDVKRVAVEREVSRSLFRARASLAPLISI